MYGPDFCTEKHNRLVPGMERTLLYQLCGLQDVLEDTTLPWDTIKNHQNHQYECSVIMGKNLSKWFPAQSGVRQGRIITPILFLAVVHWITNTTADRPRGIQWTLLS